MKSIAKVEIVSPQKRYFFHSVGIDKETWMFLRLIAYKNNKRQSRIVKEVLKKCYTNEGDPIA